MGVVIIKGRGSFGVNLGRAIVTNGDFATRLFPNYFGQDLFENRIAHTVAAGRACLIFVRCEPQLSLARAP